MSAYVVSGVRFAALLLAALSLTMESAHVLELLGSTGTRPASSCS